MTLPAFGFSPGVHDTPGQVNDLSQSLCRLSGDTHEIVVHVGRELDRVEWSFRLPRRGDKLSGR